MKKNLRTLFSLFLVIGGLQLQAQEQMVDNIVKEANENSKLEEIAHELMDVVGPRLVGTPQMKQAHDWAIKKYADWGISAENQEYGTWRAWERGITHIDMIEPRVSSLQGQQLAWSPSTKKKGVTADVVILPEASSEGEFKKILSNVKGKFVLMSALQPTGRPAHNWEKWATDKSWEKMKGAMKETDSLWRNRVKNTGYTSKELPKVLEEAGAEGIITSYWSKGFGANKIFGAYTKDVPSIDISLEDYGMLYRLAESGNTPKIKIVAQSKDLGETPTFNTIARIEGSEKPEEYIILSAHFDSWDGGTGATDNGTGTIIMMETMRILKKLYPNPKRTIIAGHWGSEEQGLNGSRAFVKDHPEIVANVQASFNQDNGTGRVKNISGQGFLHAYDYINRWLAPVPQEIKGEIETSFPGTPSRGGSDYASFVAAGAPAFSLSSLSWSYWNYTWHTNLDTYDKIVFDDVRNNVILTAIMTYMASEDPKTTSKEKAVLPMNSRTGEQMQWPEAKDATRRGGLD